MADDLPSSEHNNVLSAQELQRIREKIGRPYRFCCSLEGPQSRGESDFTQDYQPQNSQEPCHLSNHKL